LQSEIPYSTQLEYFRITRNRSGMSFYLIDRMLKLIGNKGTPFFTILPLYHV